MNLFLVTVGGVLVTVGIIWQTKIIGELFDGHKWNWWILAAFLINFTGFYCLIRGAKGA